MKKFLTVRNIVLCAGALFLLVAFFLSFAAGLKVTEMGQQATFKNIIWGCRKIIGPDGEELSIGVVFGTEKVGPAVLPFIGLLLMILSVIGAILVTLLVKKPWAKWVVVALAALAIAGAVFQFFAISQFVRAGVNAMAKEAGITDKEQINKYYEQYLNLFKNEDAKAPVSVVMGVLGILGGCALGVSALLPEKK